MSGSVLCDGLIEVNQVDKACPRGAADILGGRQAVNK